MTQTLKKRKQPTKIETYSIDGALEMRMASVTEIRTDRGPKYNHITQDIPQIIEGNGPLTDTLAPIRREAYPLSSLHRETPSNDE